MCRHGHFAFFPRAADDIARFIDHYETPLVREGEFYTFSLLKAAPAFSLAEKSYLGMTALETFEGEPWEVFRANGFVYSIVNDSLVPAASVNISIDPPRSGFYFISDWPLIQPGSRNAIGQPLLSYDGEFDLSTMELLVSEFQYE